MTAPPAKDKGNDASSPRGIPPAGWKRIVLRTLGSMSGMDTSLRCAGVAFFGFLSLFPGIGILVALLGLLADSRFLTEQVDRAAPFVPEIALEVLRERLETLVNQPPVGLGVGLTISIVVALWSGSRGMDALIYAATAAYHEKPRRPFLIAVLISILSTLAGALFLLLSLSLVAAVPVIANFSPVPGTAEQLALLLRWPLLVVLAMTGLSLLYFYALERRPAKLRWILPGATLASALWLCACLLFSLYVENFGDFEASFGSLAAAAVLLFWLYISALIFVLGAALNAEIELQTRRDSTIGPDRPMGQRGAYVADHVVKK